MKKSSDNLEKAFGKINQNHWGNIAKEWRSSQDWLPYSRKIALEVLDCLIDKKMSQKDLAQKMNVSQQMISKWLKGNENFTLDTISKIEKVLGIELITIKSQIRPDNSMTSQITQFESDYNKPSPLYNYSDDTEMGKVITMVTEYQKTATT